MENGNEIGNEKVLLGTLVAFLVAVFRVENRNRQRNRQPFLRFSWAISLICRFAVFFLARAQARGEIGKSAI
jgi:hypothetical protein